MPNKGIDELNKEKKVGQVIISSAVSALVCGFAALGKNIYESKKIDNEIEKVRDEITDFDSNPSFYKATHKNERKALQEKRDNLQKKRDNIKAKK